MGRRGDKEKAMQLCFCPDDKIHERRNEPNGPSGSLSPCLPVSLSSDPGTRGDKEKVMQHGFCPDDQIHERHNEPNGPPGSRSPHIFLAVPHYNGLEAEALPSLIQAS